MTPPHLSAVLENQTDCMEMPKPSRTEHTHIEAVYLQQIHVYLKYTLRSERLLQFGQCLVMRIRVAALTGNIDD